MAKRNVTGYIVRGHFWRYLENGKEQESSRDNDFLAPTNELAAEKVRAFLNGRDKDGWHAVNLRLIPIKVISDGTLHGKPSYTTVWDWVNTPDNKPSLARDHAHLFLDLPWDVRIETGQYIHPSHLYFVTIPAHTKSMEDL